MTTDDARPRKKRRWVRRLVILLVIAGAIYALNRMATPHIAPHTVIVVDLRSEIPERGEAGLGRFLQPAALDLAALRRVFLRAAGDDRIEGLLLKIAAGSPFGLAKAQEVRALVREFREASGKPVICYADGPDTLGCYVASAADEIWLEKSAPVSATGLDLSALFLGQAINEWGIEADFERVGAYKGSFEQLTQPDPSAAFDEAMNSLADSLFDSMVSGWAEARELDATALRDLIDAAPLATEAACAAGLADRAIGRVELRDLLETRFGPLLTFAGAERYAEATAGAEGAYAVALVQVLGPLVDGETDPYSIFGTVTGAETVVASLREAEEDAEIAGIILRIDSPGGTLTAAEKVWHHVRRTAKIKPVVASLGEVAASGGYYVASAADWIIAQPGTITGSIGIFGGKVVVEKLLERHGVGIATYDRGRNAGMFSALRPFTEIEKDLLRKQLEEGYRLFVARVADGRRMDPQGVEEVARGRVWSGEQAAARRLVDAIGGFSRAVEKIVELAKVLGAEKTEPAIRPIPPPPGLFELIRGGRRDDGIVSTASRWPGSDLQALIESRVFRDGLIGGRPVLALMPFQLIIRY